MMGTNCNTLVVTGYGINCEREMAVAARLAGAQATIIHAGRLLEDPKILNEYQLLFFPGGFSFGDELGAAKAFANKVSHYPLKLRDQLLDFVDKGNGILGVCNGFQLLIKLGLLGVAEGSSEPLVSLTYNDSGRFDNRWCHHQVCSDRNLFTQNLSELYLPLRHGEGKLICKDAKSREMLHDKGLVALKYSSNPNGSEDNIAGLCDSTGRIFGLMAHPEAYLFRLNHPHWTRQIGSDPWGDGYTIFKNAVDFSSRKLTAGQMLEV